VAADDPAPATNGRLPRTKIAGSLAGTNISGLRLGLFCGALTLLSALLYLPSTLPGDLGTPLEW
jgi:hypothetical protein